MGKISLGKIDKEQAENYVSKSSRSKNMLTAKTQFEFLLLTLVCFVLAEGLYFDGVYLVILSCFGILDVIFAIILLNKKWMVFFVLFW